MKFNDYKLILELCDSVSEALSYISVSGNTLLLGECNNALDVITSFFSKNNNDEVFDEISSLIAKMKKYLTSSDISSDELNAISEDALLLKKLCSDNIKYRPKILFVAELGAKWDAMESVYNEFKKLGTCDIEVVIQPIFRAVSLPDGSVRSESVYEDFLTPMGIENIPYEKYDISKSKPDITFISQPYDGVTTPEFTSEYIAEHSRLVYLPYFTASSIRKSLTSASDSFFMLNTQKFAWKIACQSETMEKLYGSIASLKGKNVITTGLPKWDYVYGKNKENVAMPESWKNKLSGKTTFLWNTHYTNNVDAMFEEMIKFIGYFLKHNDIALIWRPHPMTECVIKVYMPSVFPKYVELIRKINESENIIFDDSSSYLPAFVYSDALISAQSSLVTQYLLTEKPILITRNISPEIYRQALSSVDGLFDYLKLPNSKTLSDQIDFIKKIASGKDEWYDDRKYLLDNYFKLCDGQCGKRLAKALLKALEEELVDNRVSEINKVLIIGSGEKTVLCQKQLERSGIAYSLCREFSDNPDDVSLSDISSSDYDLYIVTEKESRTLIDFLSAHKKVSPTRILDFYKLYNAGIPHMVADRVFSNPMNETFDGIILGNENTKFAVIKERLKGKFADLSVDFQDMHSQYKTLDYCYKNYPEKMKDIRYAIIDLWDYHYFNIDTSLSENALAYLRNGGYSLEPHNFNRNKFSDDNFEQAIQEISLEKYEGITDEQINIWSAVFGNVYELNSFSDFERKYEKCLKTLSRKEIDQYYADFRNEDDIITINKEINSENRSAFKNLIELLYRINPEIKIYTMIIPRFVEIESFGLYYIYLHKNIINDIIDKTKEKYDFTHIDFHFVSDLPLTREYYRDTKHLNTLGAERITDELCKIIFG